MAKLTLWLEGSVCPELAQVVFEHPLLSAPLMSVRGRSSGPYRGCGSFPWSQGVRAFTYLAAATAEDAASSVEGRESLKILSGRRGSLAAALDSALSKRPRWFYEMLGCDSSGSAVGMRLFLRINPDMKHPGPVAISLNPLALSGDSIVLFHNSRRLMDIQDISTVRLSLFCSERVECDTSSEAGREFFNKSAA